MGIDAPPPEISAQVVRIYEQLCTAGALKLTPEQGFLATYKDLPPAVRRVLNYNRKKNVEQTTYIRFNLPPSTYAVVRRMNVSRDGMASKDCRIVSLNVRLEDALTTLESHSPDGKTKQMWNWGTYLPIWKVDDASRSMRHDIYEDSSGWIVINAESYIPKKPS